MEGYPRRWNGDEFYRYGGDGRALFVKNPLGDEIYATDRRRNQVYPGRGDPFARDASGRTYYARTREGDEYYPLRRRMSITRTECDGECVARAARFANGRERYPTDSEGNEFYLIEPDTLGLVLLRDENGREYLAHTKRGRDMIPWNHIRSYRKSSEPYFLDLDPASNVVYKEGRPPRCLNYCPCMCALQIPMMTMAAKSCIGA